MWYNEQTGELESNKPGATIIDDAAWKTIYGSHWKQVAPDFVPPARQGEPSQPVPVDHEKLAMAQAIVDICEKLAKAGM